MRVTDLYRMLSYGELSNLAMSSSGAGTILEADKPKILIYANDALLRLYSKFILREKDVLIELHDHVTNYHLDSRFSVTGQDALVAPIPYIKDLPLEPFENDVIKILSVYDSLGSKLPLNDAECYTSVYTPQANVLQVPNPIAGDCLSVLYQAKHPALDVARPNDIIQLPDVLHSALTGFIAYKVFSHINTQESTAKAQEHLSLYTNILSDAVESDTVITSISGTNVRFQKRGWV